MIGVKLNGMAEAGRKKRSKGGKGFKFTTSRSPERLGNNAAAEAHGKERQAGGRELPLDSISRSST